MLNQYERWVISGLLNIAEGKRFGVGYVCPDRPGAYTLSEDDSNLKLSYEKRYHNGVLENATVLVIIPDWKKNYWMTIEMMSAAVEYLDRKK